MSKNTINLDPAVKSLNLVIDSASKMAENLFNKKSSCDDICPPKQKCPPSCILTINRDAYVGERIIIPFRIKNEHKNSRTYKVGVRPLGNDQGQFAPQQPNLDTATFTIQPRQLRTVRMTIDLAEYTHGSSYQTDIVIRENKFNQNICFTLNVENNSDIPVAVPWDECDVYNQFLGWQRHFTCPHKKTGGSNEPDGPGKTGKS